MTLHNGTSRLAVVVGRNCRRVRTEAGLTQDELARYARGYGLRWNAAKVANFEAGRWEFTLATVLLVGMALRRAMSFAVLAAPARRGGGPARDRAVTLADLLDGAGELVALSDDVLVAATDLAAIGRGQPFPLRFFGDRLVDRSGLAEQRLAKALGISVSRLADLSSALWGTTFGDERDRRAGMGANQQKRGATSRELRAELEKALADGDDQ
ncbi:MAG TPA: hypothetical protein VLZ05_14930 [Mycobacterium sp.]|nr:hypothetical protein [Mycobacterium sp.]HUH70027.1 hypothetical protein [Mycobacterium sp.]